MSPSPTSDDLLAEIAGHLQARLSFNANGCSLEYREREVSLSLTHENAFVVAALRTGEQVTDEAVARGLFALFCNAGLSLDVGFPAWFGVDAQTRDLLLQFGCETAGVSAAQLAQRIEMVSDYVDHLPALA